MRLITLLLLLLLLAGCTGGVYLPNKLNTPLLTEKGDVVFSSSAELKLEHRYSSPKSARNGLNYHLAFSPAERIGVMLNYHDMNYHWYSNGILSDEINSTMHNRQQVMEIGLGLYRSLKESPNKPRSEFFAGFGRGKLDLEELRTASHVGGQDEISLNGYFNKFFLQYGFEVNIAKGFLLFGFCLRTTYVDYQTNRNVRDYYILPAHPIYLDCAYTVRMGLENIKIAIQYGFGPTSLSSNGTDKKPNENLIFSKRVANQSSFMSIGVEFRANLPFFDKN